MADADARAACVVVTYDALPWIEQCLESVVGVDTDVTCGFSSVSDASRYSVSGRSR